MRSQQAIIELGRTLAVLADVARTLGGATLAAQADVERAAVVDRIGPEVRGLAWARDLPRARTRLGRRLHSTPGQQPIPLSSREREVAALLALELTDRQIADRLVITEGTAGVHVGHILNKLGFHSCLMQRTARHNKTAATVAVRTGSLSTLQVFKRVASIVKPLI